MLDLSYENEIDLSRKQNATRSEIVLLKIAFMLRETNENSHHLVQWNVQQLPNIKSKGILNRWSFHMTFILLYDWEKKHAIINLYLIDDKFAYSQPITVELFSQYI